MVRLAGIEPTTPWFVAKDMQYHKTYINQLLTKGNFYDSTNELTLLTPCFYWFLIFSVVTI